MHGKHVDTAAAFITPGNAQQYGKVCTECNKTGHFHGESAGVNMSRAVHEVEQEIIDNKASEDDRNGECALSSAKCKSIHHY